MPCARTSNDSNEQLTDQGPSCQKEHDSPEILIIPRKTSGSARLWAATHRYPHGKTPSPTKFEARPWRLRGTATSARKDRPFSRPANRRLFLKSTDGKLLDMKRQQIAAPGPRLMNPWPLPIRPTCASPKPQGLPAEKSPKAHPQINDVDRAQTGTVIHPPPSQQGKQHTSSSHRPRRYEYQTWPPLQLDRSSTRNLFTSGLTNMRATDVCRDCSIHFQPGGGTAS